MPEAAPRAAAAGAQEEEGWDKKFGGIARSILMFMAVQYGGCLHVFGADGSDEVWYAVCE